MTTEMERLTVDTREAAHMLGVSPRTIQNYLRAGILPSRKIGKRRLILVRSLVAFLRHDQPSPNATLIHAGLGGMSRQRGVPVLQDWGDDPDEQKSADLQQIRRGIDILFEPGQVIELRALGKYGVTSGYFDDHGKLAAAVKSLSDSGDYAGVYYTLNPCHAALLSRRQKNVVHEKARDLTSDGDIIRRRWFFIDFDAKRPKGVSATRDEKQAAKEVMNAVAAWLAEQGWPAPLKAVSGNGYHLLYLVDEPNDLDTAELFKRVLQVIAERFSTDAVSIDTGVFNASRITKAYGSLAAKGANTSERPHRFSKMLNPPEPITVVSRAQLEAVITDLNNAKKPARNTENAQFSTPEKIEKFFESGGISVESRTEKEDGTILWKFACVFNSEHKDAAVFLLRNGALQFKCFHNSCAENKWPQFRAWVEAKAGMKFRYADVEPPYGATPDGLVWHKPTRNGTEEVLLTNFTAHITADTVEDDGAERRRRFEIEAALHDRKERIRKLLPASSLP